MEGANQTDDEKNGNEKMELRSRLDKMESTCDKDEEVTEKSEEEVSLLMSCKANCLSLILFFICNQIEFIPVCYSRLFFCFFSQWRRIAKEVNTMLDDTPSPSTPSPSAPKPQFIPQLGVSGSPLKEITAAAAAPEEEKKRAPRYTSNPLSYDVESTTCNICGPKDCAYFVSGRRTVFMYDVPNKRQIDCVSRRKQTSSFHGVNSGIILEITPVVNS